MVVIMAVALVARRYLDFVRLASSLCRSCPAAV
jgi:hypothetical protein